MLELSCDYSDSLFDEYEQAINRDPTVSYDATYYLKQEYHLFTFAQLVYVIFDQLKLACKDDKDLLLKVTAFFKQGAVEELRRISYRIKHKHKDFAHDLQVTIERNMHNLPKKVILTADVQATENKTQKTLRDILSRVYTEINEFTKLNFK